MAVIFDTLRFCMEELFFCSNLGLRLNDINCYVMGKKYMLSLCLLFLFCGIVIKVVKLQVISSYSEQNIFILVYNMFQHISVHSSRLMRGYSHIYWILTLQKNREGIKSSNDEELRIFKLKFAYLKSCKNRKYFIFDDSYVKVPHTAA